MDMQTMFNNAMQTGRQKELQNSPQLLLGEIILKLEQVKNKKLPLFIDLLNKRPFGIDSWRGSYCELSVQTEDFGSYQIEEVEGKFSDGDVYYKDKDIGKKNPTVAEWIEVLKETLGKTFTGYKGGDFTMSKNTPVWLAERGNSGFKIDNKTLDKKNYSNHKNVFFVDIKEEKKKVYLITKIDDSE